MTLAKPTFPAPDHDHGRCTADAITHAEQVCARRAQKFTPIRRQVLQALLSSHRPLGAYEVIDELAKSMPRPAPITVYRALDFLMENGLVHRIESRNAFLACAQDHDDDRDGGVSDLRPLRLGRRNSRRPGGAKPQRRGARVGLCAKTFRRRNRRHLRALPESLGHNLRTTAPQSGSRGSNMSVPRINVQSSDFHRRARAHPGRRRARC